MRKMKWALAAMALSLHLSSALAADGPRAGHEGTGDRASLEGFAVRFLEPKKDVKEAPERDLLVRGVPYHVVVQALDAEGKPLQAFAAQAEVEGVSLLDEEGNQKAIEHTGQLKDGRAILENVFLSADTVTVSHGSVVETVTPRTIPGWFTVVPPLLAIALAIIFRQVLVALLAGIWAGAIIIYSFNPLAALLRTFDTHVLGSLADRANASIILFTLALGGMIGVVGRSGGTRALVDAISRRAKSRRSGMIVTWLMGLVIFFDDYANCLLVGNTMRPLTDRVRISREKLSFLVDGTAAPVACIAIISTWIGVELTMLVSSGVVATPDEAFTVFIATIPYRFYSVLMLLFVFAIAFTQRDLGPMLRAEQRAIATGQVLREGAKPLVDRELTEMKVPEGKKLLWHNAVVPLAGMMLIVVLGLYLSGRGALGGKAQGAGLREIFGAADSLPVLIWASFGGGLLAVGMSLCTRAIKLSEAVDAWVVGCKSMAMAVIILVLAWTIGDMCRTHLQTGPWIISLVRPPANLMPLIFFVVSCLIAFSTGTSFGTMAIVFPIAGPMLLAVTAGSDPGLANAITLATLSSVMSGAIFGDHCSPISDTTIMSSMASAADHVDHVRTQLPYALICAGVAALVGYIPAGFGVSPWLSLLAGTGILVGILFVLGKRADATCAAGATAARQIIDTAGAGR